jgi:hypothetical protein
MKLDQALEKKIVSSIATMDRRMLDVLLPDNGVYDETYKEVWLAKLFAMYEECKEAGDETLTMYERLCTEEDDLMFGQQVYIFCAPAARWCLMLAFVVKDDVIVGLNQYFGFRQLRKEKLFDPKHDIEIGLDIYDNEMIGFVETDEFRRHKRMLHSFEKMMKNDRRKEIGRKWLLMMIKKYTAIYQETMFGCYCEEIDRFNTIITDFHNLYSFMRKPGSYVKLYNQYKVLADKDDEASVLKRRKLIGNNMLMLFSFFTSKNFGMNSKGEFTYSYTIDQKRYTLKLHLRDPRIEVAGFFPFIKESKDVISHFFDRFKSDFPTEIESLSIENMVNYYTEFLEEVLMEMDA